MSSDYTLSKDNLYVVEPYDIFRHNITSIDGDIFNVNNFSPAKMVSPNMISLDRVTCSYRYIPAIVHFENKIIIDDKTYVKLTTELLSFKFYFYIVDDDILYLTNDETKASLFTIHDDLTLKFKELTFQCNETSRTETLFNCGLVKDYLSVIYSNYKINRSSDKHERSELCRFLYNTLRSFVVDDDFIIVNCISKKIIIDKSFINLIGEMDIEIPHLRDILDTISTSFVYSGNLIYGAKYNHGMNKIGEIWMPRYPCEYQCCKKASLLGYNVCKLHISFGKSLTEFEYVTIIDSMIAKLCSTRETPTRRLSIDLKK